MIVSTARNSYLKTDNQTQDVLSSKVIDNVAVYPTPEGLMLTLMPAGMMPRLSAWIIDALIKALFYTVVTFAGVFFGEAGAGFMLIGYFLISWLYPVFFEVYRYGMTPGKKSQGIYVCHDDGTPVTLQASLIRNLLRVADFLPFAYVSAALVMLFNKKSQRIGDIVAGTIVVYRSDDNVTKLFRRVKGKTATLTNSDNYGQTLSIEKEDVATAPLFFYPLTLKEQQAILSFSERAPFWSKERQIEMASILAPLVDNDNTHQSTTNLIDINRPGNIRLLVVVNARANAIRGDKSGASQSEASQLGAMQANAGQSLTSGDNRR